jgi:hypothetical protein
MRPQFLIRFSVAAFLILSMTSGLSYPNILGSYAAQNQTVLQPSIKRNVYVFFDEFPDVKNSTPPSHLLLLLSQINSYFNNVTFGAWQFNWTLYYPSLGQPWYMVNETYARAGSNGDLTPIFEVISQAYNSGSVFPSEPQCCYPTNTLSALIIHAGNSSAITGKVGYDIWPVTTGPYCVGPPGGLTCLLGSVIAETDPIGVIMYEMTHELQQFNEFGIADADGFPDPTGAIPSSTMIGSNWDEMWQGLYNGNPIGTRPIEYGSYTRMSLGFLPLSQIAVVNRGQAATVALDDLEEPTSGYQAIRVPIRNDTNGFSYFYMIELRKGVSTDYYYPWAVNQYPDRTGMLIWYFRSRMTGGTINGFIVKAHDWDTSAATALFGPCKTPCNSSMSMYDSTNNISVTIISTSNSSFQVHVNNLAPLPSNQGCPNIWCFLGFFDLGYLNTALNGFVLGLSISIAILLYQRRRKHDLDLLKIPGKKPEGLN